MIDGEHGWRAAQELGLDKFPCEIFEAGDSEAMRQTWKRNQHGKHSPVLEGRMFRQMMQDQDGSLRQLAREIEVSEVIVGKGRETCRGSIRLPFSPTTGFDAERETAFDDWNRES